MTKINSCDLQQGMKFGLKLIAENKSLASAHGVYDNSESKLCVNSAENSTSNERATMLKTRRQRRLMNCSRQKRRLKERLQRCNSSWSVDLVEKEVKLVGQWDVLTLQVINAKKRWLKSWFVQSSIQFSLNITQMLFYVKALCFSKCRC